MNSRGSTRHIVVMGVSGCGKTTIARGISEVTGVPYGEADEFHSQANVDKMRAGIPLNDDDRWPWLRDLAAWMAEQAAQDRSTVMACSALKRAYRNVLRNGPPTVQFVHLDGPAEVIRKRMEHRSGHYMPATLLASQFAILEPLEPDEDGIVLDLTLPPDVLVNEAIEQLDLPRRSESDVQSESDVGSAVQSQSNTQSDSDGPSRSDALRNPSV